MPKSKPTMIKRHHQTRGAIEKPVSRATATTSSLVATGYRDYANATEATIGYLEEEYTKNTEAGNKVSGTKDTREPSFPMKLHYMLREVEKDGHQHIISWQPHGRCFVVHKRNLFAVEMLDRWFRQTKYTSFQRQLNLYGFTRITKGPDKGGYYHELFLRGKFFLCEYMVRQKIKGNKGRQASDEEAEPDFYSGAYSVLPPAWADGSMPRSATTTTKAQVCTTESSNCEGAPKTTDVQSTPIVNLEPISAAARCSRRSLIASSLGQRVASVPSANIATPPLVAAVTTRDILIARTLLEHSLAQSYCAARILRATTNPRRPLTPQTSYMLARRDRTGFHPYLMPEDH